MYDESLFTNERRINKVESFSRKEKLEVAVILKDKKTIISPSKSLKVYYVPFLF